MTSILFLTGAIYCNIFRGNYLGNEKYFLIFFSFSKFRLNFEHFQKKMTLIADVFFFGLRKTWSDKCRKSPVSEGPSTSNMVNGRKYC